MNLSSLIKVKIYNVILRNSLIKVYTICHYKQSDQGLHCLPFSAVWSGSALFANLSSLIKVKIYNVILRNSLIKVYTICHYKQSDQGLHCLQYLSFSAVWSGSTLFYILSSLIKVYTVCHSQQSDQGIHYCHSQKSDQGLHYLPFFLSSLIKVYTVCHSQQSDQHLHYLPFSAVWSRSTVFANFSSLIKVCTICHSQQSDQGLQYLPFSLSSIIEVCTVCHSL